MNANYARGCRRLEGKAVVVAGASTGIGRGTALRLAAEGATVAVAAPPGDQRNGQSGCRLCIRCHG